MRIVGSPRTCIALIPGNIQSIDGTWRGNLVAKSGILSRVMGGRRSVQVDTAMFQEMRVAGFGRIAAELKVCFGTFYNKLS